MKASRPVVHTESVHGKPVDKPVVDGSVQQADDTLMQVSTAGVASEAGFAAPLLFGHENDLREADEEFERNVWNALLSADAVSDMRDKIVGKWELDTLERADPARFVAKLHEMVCDRPRLPSTAIPLAVKRMVESDAPNAMMLVRHLADRGAYSAQRIVRESFDRKLDEMAKGLKWRPATTMDRLLGIFESAKDRVARVNPADVQTIDRCFSMMNESGMRERGCGPELVVLLEMAEAVAGCSEPPVKLRDSIVQALRKGWGVAQPYAAFARTAHEDASRIREALASLGVADLPSTWGIGIPMDERGYY